ncbi:hypothetical protein FG379_002082 [Cryptosporidium bovis]|uniref:uncharacterized protein n=1 Tax=Cryptosporidium bovis TaxID=310047 RepID=UPI00351A13A2|nr:hypothetical protein FG379_002082 [Cryptosporidium bovis]
MKRLPTMLPLKRSLGYRWLSILIIFVLVFVENDKKFSLIVTGYDLNAEPNRVYYYPIGFNLADVYTGPAVGNFLSIDSQVTNFVSPCQFMHPITLQFIGIYENSGKTPLKSISCDSKSLEKSISESSKIKSDTVNIVKACSDIAQVILDSKISYSVFNGVNNITIWLEGSKLVDIVKDLNNELQNKIPRILDRDVKYQFYHEIFTDTDNLGIQSYLFKTITFPFKISVNYEQIYPGLTSYATDIPVIEFSANITLSHEYSSQTEAISSFWNPPNGFGGFFPMLIPNDKFANVVLSTTYTEPGKESGFVAWGSTNIAMTSPSVRIIPPSRIPQTELLCTSNYDFYYPTTEKPAESESEVKEYPKKLDAILDKSSGTNIYRNTISTQSYWNKIPFGAEWYESGFPVGSPNSQWIETQNFYGGCYFNGTFPLVPSVTNEGFKDTLCFEQANTISDQYKTAFYPPPLGRVIYGVSNYQTMTTSILQYGVEKYSGLNKVFEYNSNVDYMGSYPSYHIFGASSPLQLTSPYPRLDVPFVQYSGRDLEAGDPFFNFNFQFMQDRFGHCAEANGCWQCSNPRLIPWKTDMIDQMNFTEFCSANRTKIPNYDIITFRYFTGILGSSIDEQHNSGFESCVNSEENIWTPVGKNTTHFTLAANSYKTNTMFLYNTLSNDTCCSPMNTYFFYQNYYTIVTDKFQPIQLTQINPYTEPFIGGILPGIFMNREFSYSFYIDVFNDDLSDTKKEGEIWTSDSIMKLKSWLICPEIDNIDLPIYPESLKIQDIKDVDGKVGASITIPKNLFYKYYDSPTFCVVRAFVFLNEEYEKDNYQKLRGVRFEEYRLESPRIYESSEGMHEYVQWILVNNGFITKDSDVIQPIQDSVTIADALYTPVDVIHEYNYTITPFLFYSIAVDSPVFTPESQIFEMVVAGQHNRFGLRLPSTHSEWYVFARSTDKWDQGCFVKCKGDMSRSPYANWCLPEFEEGVNNPFEYNLCNYTIVRTSEELSDTQIEDAIAVLTNPISYLSYVDTMSLFNAIFSLPTTNEVVWKEYFDVIYNTAIDSHVVSFNQDYPFAQPTTLAAMSRIYNKYYYRERLDINTKLPLNSIERIYTVVECFLIDGIDNIVLNTTDIVGAINPLPVLTPDELQILLGIYQGVASRKSYTQGVGGSYSLVTEKTGNSFFSSTFNKVDLKNGVNVGGNKFPSIVFSDISEDDILLHRGVYYKMNKLLYNIGEANEGYKQCKKNVNTVTVIRTGNYLSNHLVINGLENIEEYPLAFSSIVLCTLEFEIWNLKNPVEFSLFAEYKEELDYSGIKCTAMQKDYLGFSSSLCKTEQVVNFETQTIEFICKCNAITYYGMEGKAVPYIESTTSKDLSPLFSKTNPNILQPFLLVSNPPMTSTCNDFLPITIQLKNLPKTIPDENFSLEFNCKLPEDSYDSLEFCTEFGKSLQNLDYTFSRLGSNVNITYFASPTFFQTINMPTNFGIWRPENMIKKTNTQSIITVYIEVRLELSKLELGNDVQDLYDFIIFDLIISGDENISLASEFGEISRIHLMNKYINIPGAYTKDKVPIPSIKYKNTPFSVPNEYSEKCSSYLEKYFSGSSANKIYFDFGEKVAIEKNINFVPSLLESFGGCYLSVNKEEYVKSEAMKCNYEKTAQLVINENQNAINQPISLMHLIFESSSSSLQSSLNNIIIHNETITPNIMAKYPEIVFGNYPKMSFEIGNSKTIEQIVASKGYCDVESSNSGISCNSCRGLRSYQADFQYSNQEIRYLCAATSDEDDIETISQGLSNACTTDGFYWGQACSTQQSNATISGNTTLTEFNLVPQTARTYLVFAIGIRSHESNAIQCRTFNVILSEQKSPIQIITKKVPSTIPYTSRTYLNTAIKYVGKSDGWESVQEIKFASFLYFENTGLIRLITSPETFELSQDETEQFTDIDISITIDIRNYEINPRDEKVSILLVVLKKTDDENENNILSESNLNSLVKRSNIQNMVSSGGYVSYVWSDIPFENDYSTIKMSSSTIINPGIKQVIPLNFKLSNKIGMSDWKYSLLATAGNPGQSTSTQSTLLTYLSPNLPQYIRLPTSNENWLVHLIIHNKNNDLVCGIDCSSISNIDEHLRKMFCASGNSSKCMNISFRANENSSMSLSDIQREYSSLFDYYENEKTLTNIVDESDTSMIESILTSNIRYLTTSQMMQILKIILDGDYTKRELSGGILFLNLYSVWKVFDYIRNNQEITVDELDISSLTLKQISELLLKSECGFNSNYPKLVIDILDFILERKMETGIEDTTSLLGALSTNQWIMSNTFGDSINLNGINSKVNVASYILSEIQLGKGIELKDSKFKLPPIKFNQEGKTEVHLIKNIYYHLNENMIFDSKWSSYLLSNCFDSRYGITIIRPSLENYLNELAGLVKSTKNNKLENKFKSTYQAFISRCGYEYNIYNLNNVNVEFLIAPEYTPGVVSERFVTYECASKQLEGSDSQWDTTRCTTSIYNGQIACSCDSIGEYGLKLAQKESLNEVEIVLTHNPGSIQEAVINDISYKIINGKFYYKEQVIDILVNELLIIKKNEVSFGEFSIPLEDYTEYDTVTKLTLRQEGALGEIILTSKEINIKIDGSNIISDGFIQGPYTQNSTLIVV